MGTLTLVSCPGYHTDEASFQRAVEAQADFKPEGKLVYSYTRPSPSAKSKGKATSLHRELDPTSEDVVEFEVYHVRVNFSFFALLLMAYRQHGIPQGLENTTGECRFSFCSILKVDPILVRMRTLGNSWFCTLLFFVP